MEYDRSLTGLSTDSFYRCIHQLNPRLRICCFENSLHAAGLYYIDPQEGWISVCGVDKGWVPVAATVDEIGHIIKSGWYRVVRLLLSRGLTTPQKVTRIWPGFFSCRVPRAEFQNVDPILKRIGKFVSEEENKHGEQGMTADQIMEVAEEVHKTDSDGKKEQSAKDKWEFNKELGKNQKIFI